MFVILSAMLNLDVGELRDVKSQHYHTSLKLIESPRNQGCGVGCVIQDTFLKEPRETLIVYGPTASKVKWSRNLR